MTAPTFGDFCPALAILAVALWISPVLAMALGVTTLWVSWEILRSEPTED